jgi:hypothetical protein
MTARRLLVDIDGDLMDWLELSTIQERTSLEELIRRFLRERGVESRRESAAMTRVIGLWNDRDDIADTEALIRSLRKGRGRVRCDTIDRS